MRGRIFLLLGSLLMVPSVQAQSVMDHVTPVFRDGEDDERSFDRPVQERVTLSDGREVELYRDHTWGYARRHNHFRDDRGLYQPHTASEAVQVWDSSLDWMGGDPFSKVRLFLHYRNRTPRRVVGVSVKVTISDSFGRILFNYADDDDVTLEPNQQMTNHMYYSWNNDPNDNDGTYDRLWRVARNRSARVSVTVTRVVFEDGTQLTNEREGDEDGDRP